MLKPLVRAVFFISGFIYLIISLGSYIHRPHQVGEVDRKPPPIFGIALAADHAVVSVRYEDGTVEDWRRFEADQEYIELMQRLSLPSSQHRAYDTPI